jgi:hypothetical protein
MRVLIANPVDPAEKQELVVSGGAPLIVGTAPHDGELGCSCPGYGEILVEGVGPQPSLGVHCIVLWRCSVQPRWLLLHCPCDGGAIGGIGTVCWSAMVGVELLGAGHEAGSGDIVQSAQDRSGMTCRRR